MEESLKAPYFVEAALEASVYVNPRESGLSLEELTKIGAYFGLKPGAIRDAVTSEANMIERPIQGRARLKVGIVHFSIHVSLEGDRRNVGAFETVAQFIRGHLDEYGKDSTEITREQFARLAADNHAIDVELAMMELAELVRLTTSTVAITSMGVNYFRNFERVGERVPWNPRRPRFADIYAEVEKTILFRPLAAGSVSTKTLPESVSTKTLPGSVSTTTLSESVRAPMIRVFVSHAAQNKTVASKFVRLILEAGIGVPKDAIFFSSRFGSIPPGKYFVPYIRDQLVDAKLVIGLITPKYRTRPFCIAEMGAAWAFVPDGFIPLLHNVTHGEMDGVLDGMQALKLSDKKSLNEVRKQVMRVLGLKEGDYNQWEEERDEFISKLAEFEATDGPSDG